MAATADPLALWRGARGAEVRGPKPAVDVGGVGWDPRERVDFSLGYHGPAAWPEREAARENYLSLQMAPDTHSPQPHNEQPAGSSGGGGGGGGGGASTVHGIAITAYAYHRPVAAQDAAALASTFLRRFLAGAGGHVLENQSSINNSSSSSSSNTTSTSGASTTSPAAVAAALEAQLPASAVRAVAFAPLLSGGLRIPSVALCRALYHPSGRFHYVVVAAAPEADWAATSPQLIHAVSALTPLGHAANLSP